MQSAVETEPGSLDLVPVALAAKGPTLPHIHSDAQWPREKRAYIFWLVEFEGEPFPKEQRAPLGNWDDSGYWRVFTCNASGHAHIADHKTGRQ